MDGKLFEKALMRLDDFFQETCIWLGELFDRRDTAQRAASYTKALLTNIERKNSWQMAEAVGFENPYAFQHLLGRASWDHDAVRDALVSHAKEELGTKGAVLAIDETGFVKKGEASAGVARQYSGTAGRIENCQIGVFLSYSTAKGHTLIDRELYLPEAWTSDKKRLASVGLDRKTKFQTKIQLARTMLERAYALGVTADWVVADSVYGNDTKFRFWLEERRQFYVLAVSSAQHITHGFDRVAIGDVMAALPKNAWHRISIGTGSKGQRRYDFAATLVPHPYDDDVKRWAICRRPIDNPTDPTYFLAFTPADVTLTDIAKAIGRRWQVEECFETAKGEVGLDQYEVRSAVGWYRHMTLAMVAQYVLVASRSRVFPPPQRKQVSMADFKKKRGLSS